jgi:hypothetical protein
MYYNKVIFFRVFSFRNINVENTLKTYQYKKFGDLNQTSQWTVNFRDKRVYAAKTQMLRN